MLEWMIAFGAILGALAGFAGLVVALEITRQLRDARLAANALPTARVVRCRRFRQLTSARYKALPSGE